MASSKTRKIVLVKWVDPTTINQWITYEQLEEFKFKVNPSIGFLIEDTEERVSVVQTPTGTHVTECLILPRGCVLAIDEVGEVEIDD